MKKNIALLGAVVALGICATEASKYQQRFYCVKEGNKGRSSKVEANKRKKFDTRVDRANDSCKSQGGALIAKEVFQTIEDSGKQGYPYVATYHCSNKTKGASLRVLGANSRDDRKTALKERKSSCTKKRKKFQLVAKYKLSSGKQVVKYKGRASNTQVQVAQPEVKRSYVCVYEQNTDSVTVKARGENAFGNALMQEKTDCYGRSGALVTAEKYQDSSHKKFLYCVKGGNNIPVVALGKKKADAERALYRESVEKGGCSGGKLRRPSTLKFFSGAKKFGGFLKTGATKLGKAAYGAVAPTLQEEGRRLKEEAGKTVRGIGKQLGNAAQTAVQGGIKRVENETNKTLQGITDRANQVGK